MKSILDPTFRYVPSVATDVRKTFARIRREMSTVKALPAANADTSPRVVPIKRAGAPS
jgi:hypothetical protein